MGASRCCLLPVFLILLGAPVIPAQPADGDRPPQTDLSARLLAVPPLEGRQLVGQTSVLVSAAQGKAFVLESVEGQPSARAIKTSAPVYKAFGLNANAERLLYRPLAGNAPSGELIVEELATGACAGSAPAMPSRRPGLLATATCWPSRSRAGKATASRC